MHHQYRGPKLFVMTVEGKGLSVFAAEDIISDSIIELCQVIILNKEDTQAIHRTHLHDYYFIWDIEKGESAIALGNGSVYNHSEEANATFTLDHENRLISFYAIKDIAAGDEITIDYLPMKESGYELWFKPI